MNLTHYDLRQCRRGQTIEATLTSGAIARLLDLTNLSSYRHGQRHQSIAKKYPVRVPHAPGSASPRPHGGYSFNDVAERKSSACIALLANVSMCLCSSRHKVSATWCGLRGSAFMTCCIPGELGPLVYPPFARRYSPLQPFAACGSGVGSR
ncbi:DUF1883 domain-containing protein [Mesorhizobium sp. 113-1-2]|uniref:DUF1883 domain-containing protein n=1 Tax=Mesorhizobium sp. 113-1-2 TaxID=2744515 RepID=UPI0019295572